MKGKKHFIILAALCLFSLHTHYAAAQADWDQFRGASRDGSASGSARLSAWPETGPKVKWTREIGSGFSEILISGDRIYTMFAEKADSLTGWEYVASFDAATGREIWRTELDSVFIDVDGWGDGPRSTPAMDGNWLYCFTGHGKLFAVSRMDGSIRWSVDFVKEFESTLPRWGFSASPILMDQYVIMEVGGSRGRAFVAFDSESGKVVWSAGEGEAMYSSPITANINGQEQVIFVNGRNMVSFNNQGKVLWTHNMPIGNPMASPVFIPPTRIFASANNGAGSFVVEPGTGNTSEIFQSSAMKNDWSSSVYKDGYIYGFNLAALQCISATDGQRKWNRRGFGKGSLILVDDVLLVLSDQGELSMVAATPEGFRTLGSVQLIEGRSWTAPSFSGKRVFVRNNTHMACVELQ